MLLFRCSTWTVCRGRFDHALGWFDHAGGRFITTPVDGLPCRRALTVDHAGWRVTVPAALRIQDAFFCGDRNKEEEKQSLTECGRQQQPQQVATGYEALIAAGDVARRQIVSFFGVTHC